MSEAKSSQVEMAETIVITEPSRFSSKLRRKVERLGDFAENIAAILVLMIAGLIGYEVIARYLFGNPTGFANQIAAYGMPFIAFLAAAATLGKNAHVTVDALVDALSKKNRQKLEPVTELISLLLLTGVTGMAVLEVHDNWLSGTRDFSTVLTFPEFLPQIVMPFGLALLTCYQFFKFVDAVRSLTAPK